MSSFTYLLPGSACGVTVCGVVNTSTQRTPLLKFPHKMRVKHRNNCIKPIKKHRIIQS